MQIGPFTLARTKSLQLQPLSGRGGWTSWIREPAPGAWQKNQEVKVDNVATHSIVFSCIGLIASSIAKLGLGLVEQDEDGIWTATESSAFSPVLREPNPWQTIQQFIESWIVSKLLHGNVYVLLGRDQRGLVNQMYVLDPLKVTVLVSTSGDVYYQVSRDDLAGLSQDTVTIPASEIIHDRMVALWHPLIGVSPITACGLAAMQGLAIVNNSSTFFSNGSNPSGFLTAPGAISDATAARLKAYFDTNFSGSNRGKVAVGGDGLKYEPFSMSAVDSQLVAQLQWSGQTVCSTFRVPAYLVGCGEAPPFASITPLLQSFYSNCLQPLITALETTLGKGLALPARFGVELDIDDLIWMDAPARVAAAKDAITAGMSPNEARRTYFGLGPVTGGDSPMLQQQLFSLAALAQRDANDPFPKAPTEPTPPTEPTSAAEADVTKAFAAALRTKALAAGLLVAA